MKALVIFAIKAVLCLGGVNIALCIKAADIYLAPQIDQAFEADILRLKALGGIVSLKKPYSVSAIKKATEAISAAHPQLYQRLSSRLERYSHSKALTHASVELRHEFREDVSTPNDYGVSSGESVKATGHGYARLNQWLSVSLGGVVSENIAVAAGSMLSLGRPWLQLDIGYKPYWLSPFQGASQTLSTNAEIMPSVSVSNPLPIMLGGHGILYDFFIAQTSRQPTLYRSEFNDDKGPLLAGVYLEWQPAPWWAMSATRLFQFAGGKRPVDLKVLGQAFYDPRTADNDSSVDEESGNQVAALASQMNFEGAVPFSFAVELAGEDTSNNKAVQLGNPAMTAGLFFPTFFSENVSLNLEYANWDNGWYVNNVYQEGYTHQGVVLGHWAMQDQRNPSGRLLAAPAKSHYLGVNYLMPNGHSITANLRHAEHQREGLKEHWGLDATYAFIRKKIPVETGIFIGRNALDQDFMQFNVSVHWR